MSKEMTIVFVYDTSKRDDFEDPVKSVIYFHPSWVSEMQKLLLCGQIMAVGSDRNISEDILEHRANFLYTLLKLYHSDLNAIYEQINSNDKQAKYADKIYTILESYLPLLQCNGNIFQNVSSLKIPKSASNFYLETSQILQSFQQVKGVLGGTMLYHNKVVASQLPDSLTKMFTLSDLYRLKSSEYIAANYHIPVGVTLINAYISTSDYAKLLRTSTEAYNLLVNTMERDTFTFQLRRKSFSKDSHSLMKRDKSLIFTNIPEEDMEDTNGSVKLINKKKNNRPTNLPLFFKNQTALETTESGFNSINFDDSDSFPNFIGKTSVCSTPMTENKLLSHSNVLSICAVNEDAKKLSNYFNLEHEKSLTDNQTEEKIDILKHKQEEQFNTYFNNFISKPHFLKARSTSSSSLGEISVSMDSHGSENKNERNIPRLKTLTHNDFCKSVADPIYPIFSTNGKAVSYSVFKELLEVHYNNLISCTDNNPPKRIIDSITQENPPGEIMKTTFNDPTGNDRLQTTVKNRSDLFLPIKTMNSDGKFSGRTQTNIFEPPAHCRKMTNLQLTPLMSKLTFINSNNDLQSSGFSSNDTTPGNFNILATPLEYQTKRKKSKNTAIQSATENLLEQDVTKPVKVELFVCVQQNMTLVLVLQDKSCEKEEIINTLFETCVSKLPRIENSLHQVMSINVEGCDKGDGNYSFISLDCKWDVKNRCGPWIPNDLLTLNYLHNNFRYNHKLIECILKSQDTVIYSYRCGRTEIYYQQSSVVHPGLPIPQDVMGTVALCAKRRLERDHGILLL
ncbi:uncharacterized protein LOC129775062 isoform X2 [Toxorhynchites rutilus septentrionalis]|uniref:uncharacterized protein LOC129775062 isoform X2 n=1 Tax=Toxorhynchites rutilus septentrionalis TaxID=329112 RepID=UPI002479ABC1|nr:uncharacterized protein LOC129775062 isoform X2 [Toxorhynchites rutilus septentrionalis]